MIPRPAGAAGWLPLLPVLVVALLLRCSTAVERSTEAGACDAGAAGSADLESLPGCSSASAPASGAPEELHLQLERADYDVDGSEQAVELLQKRGSMLRAQHRRQEAELSPPGQAEAASASSAAGAGEARRPPGAARPAAAAAAALADAGAGEQRRGRRRHKWFDLYGYFKQLFLACGPIFGSNERCSDAIFSNSKDVFGAASHVWKGVESFSSDELNAFRSRFTKALAEESKTVMRPKFIWDRFSAWRSAVGKCFSEQRPTVSKALVNFVNANSAALGWTAKYHLDLQDRSVSKYKQMLGLEEDEEGGDDEAAQSKSAQEASDEDLAFLRASPSLATAGATAGAAAAGAGAPEEPQGPFAVWDKWPQCSDVMRHVRFQTCPNCWSHSTALITESRVCIMLGGNFVGRDAWLSQSYIAACRLDGRHYCAAAGGSLGYQTVTQWGVPTGASDRNGNADPQARTCYPQISPELSGVNCPASCAEDGDYPRDLQHDTFFLRYVGYRSLRPSSELTHLLAKRSLMEEGPIMVGFRAYVDLQAYVSGIYRPAKTRDNFSLGGHAVTAMGFGPGYYLCTNSWGDKWGDRGTFKIATDAVNIGFYLPGKVEYGKYKRFPVPVP